MNQRPELRLVISNHALPTIDKPSSTLPSPPSTSLVTMSELHRNLDELMHLKPSNIGGIAVLVCEQVRRMRIEHPVAAREYAAMHRIKHSVTT